MPPKANWRASLSASRLIAPTVTVTVIAVLMYLRPVFKLGFYYDDWILLARMQDAPGDSWSERYAACRDADPASRFGGCLYHASVNFLLGDHTSAYHLLSIGLLATSAVLLYALLRRCRLGKWPSLLACVLFVIYPGSDATRLWPTGVVGQYVLGAYLGSVLLAIVGLRRGGVPGLVWHAASLALFVLLLFTYEVVVPPIAIAGLFYLLAMPAKRKAAIIRGGVDLALALSFTAFRLVIDPVQADSGFVQGRTIGQWFGRVETVLHGAWTSWKPLFLPGSVALTIAFVAGLLWIAAMVEDRDVRRDSVPWLIAAGASLFFAIASVLAYVTANDLYVPDSYSLFDRLNLAAAPAYCVLFVALCGLLWTALVHWLSRTASIVIVGVLVLGVVAVQVPYEVRSQQAWAASWDDQTAAIARIRALAPQLPTNASVMSFGHPMYERGFIPVFAASWDLRGAIDHETRVDPPDALPFSAGAQCGPTSVLLAGKPYLEYRALSPLWFVNLANGQARRISSTAECEAAIAAWGRPPFWGKTVTG
jgi:hypothetical protein